MISKYTSTSIDVVDPKEVISSLALSDSELKDSLKDIRDLCVEILRDLLAFEYSKELKFSFNPDTFPKTASVDDIATFLKELEKIVHTHDDVIKELPDILFIPLVERLLLSILPNHDCLTSLLSIMSSLSSNRLTSEKTALLFQYNTMTAFMAYSALDCKTSILFLSFLSSLLDKRHQQEIIHKKSEKTKSKSKPTSRRTSTVEELFSKPAYRFSVDAGIASFASLPAIPFYDDTIRLLFSMWEKHSSDPSVCLFLLNIIQHGCRSDVSLDRFYSHGVVHLLKAIFRDHKTHKELVRRILNTAEVSIRMFDVKLKLLQEGFCSICESAIQSFITHQPIALVSCRLLTILCYVGYRLEHSSSSYGDVDDHHADNHHAEDHQHPKGTEEATEPIEHGKEEGCGTMTSSSSSSSSILHWRVRHDVIAEVIIQHRKNLAGCAASFILFVLEDKDPARLRRDIFHSFENCVFHDFEKYHIHVASFSQHTTYEHHRYLLKTDIPKRLRKYYIKPSQMKFEEKLVLLLYKKDSHPTKICAVCHGHRDMDVYQTLVTWRNEFTKSGLSLNVNPSLFKP
ncbi:hypothetical protein ADUPG1_012575 [Aduncisulcus paluster]|uniref:FPL domain-containing protein n=1 Tax=Aduncisulcus paluster TaxID=2918883 RepID=A0ABQ5K357_9EUKA|nr:hypothetical protein ADUPG1_012575 [Aduncisulcus paluster]